MSILSLRVEGFRNLKPLSLEPHPGFNVLTGGNGSGKTSFLEAIYLLSRGSSFRTRHLFSLLQTSCSQWMCFADVQMKTHRFSLGMARSLEGDLKCHVSGERCHRLSQFVQHLPVQLLTPESLVLLQAEPSVRRHFLDWGVFHVEPSFATISHRYRRLLQQRNAALRRKENAFQWDIPLAETGEALHLWRKRYWEIFVPILQCLTHTLLPSTSIRVRLSQGWETDLSLSAALKKHYRQDLQYGYTTVGPHRAEIEIWADDLPAKERLSRGHQKLCVCALYFAQASLTDQQGKKSLFLVDDLASELEEDNRHRVLAYLVKEGYQVFLTSLQTRGWWEWLPTDQRQLFHVEQGHVGERALLCSRSKEGPVP